MVSRRDFLRGRFLAHPRKENTADRGTADADGRKLAVIGPNCIVFTQNVVCRSCGDACDAAAIRFSPRLYAAALPLVLEKCCTGCGECLAVCPVGAISLQGSGDAI